MRWRSSPLLLLALCAHQTASEVQVGDPEHVTPAAAIGNASSPPHQLPDARVQFFGNSTEPLACGGLQIARDVVLTSASCLQTLGRVATVSLTRSGALRPVAKTIVHPRFEQTNDTQFDVALLIAPRGANETSAVGTERTLVLDSRGVADSEQLDRLQLGSSAELELELVTLSQCTSSQSQTDAAATSSSSQSAQCIQTLDKHHQPQATTNAALLRHPADSSTTSYLAGLQTGASRADLFVSSPDIANFVNAYSTGHSWGASPQPSRDLSSSKAPWTRETTIGFAKTSSSQYVVALRSEKNGQKFCGGSLIAPTFVLTTANCVSDGLANFVAIGSDTLTSGVEVIRVAKNRTVIHPSFGRPYKASFDAAIIELEFAAYAQPITLSTVADFTDGTHATMTSAATSISVPVWSKRTCEATVPSLDSSILCAGGEAGQDACAGDAGSPLMIVSSDGKQQLIGVVSAGYGCGRPGVPGLYTRVAALAEFVQAHSVATRVTSTAAPDSTTSNVINSTPVISEVASDSSEGAKGITWTASTSKRSTLPSLKPMTREKFLEFLLQGSAGVSTNVQLDGLLEKFIEGSSEVELHSTADVSALLAVVAKHNALPLNQRKDRFGSFSVATNRPDAVTTVGEQACGGS